MICVLPFWFFFLNTFYTFFLVIGKTWKSAGIKVLTSALVPYFLLHYIWVITINKYRIRVPSEEKLVTCFRRFYVFWIRFVRWFLPMEIVGYPNISYHEICITNSMKAVSTILIMTLCCIN